MFLIIVFKVFFIIYTQIKPTVAKYFNNVIKYIISKEKLSNFPRIFRIKMKSWIAEFLKLYNKVN